MDEPTTKKEPQAGAFLSSLKRNNKQIRDDRATAIAEEAEVKFRRKVEDLEMSINNMKREQDAMLDMSPENAQSLILASDFKADEFVGKTIELGVKIRQEEIRMEVAKKQYVYLFGEGGMN